MTRQVIIEIRLSKTHFIWRLDCKCVLRLGFKTLISQGLNIQYVITPARGFSIKTEDVCQVQSRVWGGRDLAQLLRPGQLWIRFRAVYWEDSSEMTF